MSARCNTVGKRRRTDTLHARAKGSIKICVPQPSEEKDVKDTTAVRAPKYTESDTNVKRAHLFSAPSLGVYPRDTHKMSSGSKLTCATTIKQNLKGCASRYLVAMLP